MTQGGLVIVLLNFVWKISSDRVSYFEQLLLPRAIER